MKTDGATFTITYTENGKLTVTLVDQTWGTAIINNVDAIISKKGDGKYSLQPADGKIVITNPANQEQIEYDCRLHSGYISDDLSTAEDVNTLWDFISYIYFRRNACVRVIPDTHRKGLIIMMFSTLALTGLRAESVSTYKNTWYWWNFGSIVAIE